MKRTLMQTTRAALVAAALASPALAQTPMPDALTGSGQNTGSAADSDSSAAVGGMTRDRLAADLQSGTDFGRHLTDLTETTPIAVIPLSAMDQTAGPSIGTIQDGAVPLTGGQNTVNTPPSASGSAGASAGMGGGSPAGISDGAATGSTATVSVNSGGGAPLGLDGALTAARDDLSALHDQLRGQDRVMQALDDAGHAPGDVIGLDRDDQALLVFVDDRDA